MAQTLDYNKNVTAVVPVTIPTFDDDLEIIQKLDDEPNDVGGLTPAELKAKFDEGNLTAQQYINNVLIPQVIAGDATEQARQAAESERVSNEIDRVGNEFQRVTAEQERVAVEAFRVSAEESRVSAEASRVSAEQARADETAGIVAQATAQATAAKQSADNAASSESTASKYVSAAASSASSAAASASSASTSASAANASASAASASQTAAKNSENQAKYWAEQAQGAVGGDFATRSEAQGYANTAESNANKYTDQKIAALPAPDVSGQISVHNVDSAAHSDIRELIANKKGAQVYTATIGATWTEDSDTGVNYQTVAITGVTADNTAKVDHSSASIDGTSDGYAVFVEEENQYLTHITNGYAETVADGVKFVIFGDAPTISIPIVVEVV